MSSSSATTGQVIGLAYGYVWGTGRQLAYRMLQNTGSDALDYTRLGLWALGEGEWDGCEYLMDAALGRRLFKNENDDPTKFHFHRGCDSVIGSGLAPSSSGPDQAVDSYYTDLPAGVQPQTFNRIAYYGLRLKQLINNPPNTNQDDSTVWADISPIGCWRSRRVRIFDATGAMVDYAFSTDPIACYVDMMLSRKIKPEYNIDIDNGSDDLTAAERKRFSWSALDEASQYFAEILSNGRRRMEMNVLFDQATSWQAMESQMLQMCRSYRKDYGGAIGIFPDKPRASVFTFTRANVLTFEANDRNLHLAANRMVPSFRDLLVTSCGDIEGIYFPDHGSPIVTTKTPHPMVDGDDVQIGGTGTAYDKEWQVEAKLSDNAVSLVPRGSNYPTSVGAIGRIGLVQTRFKERAPSFEHHQNQTTRGALGVGIPRQRSKVSQQIELATTTYDQSSRISRYERDRALGKDASPYAPPIAADITCELYARDASPGSRNIAISLEPGDIITVDPSVSEKYAALYEVIDPDFDSQPSQASGGSCHLTLSTYDQTIFYDDSDETSAGWNNVPGSDPGNNSGFTIIPLQDGEMAFFTGTDASGATIDLPSVGFNPANVLGWVSPAGTIEADHQLHVLRDCSVSAQRKLNLVYSDGNDPSSNVWTGDLGYAFLCWRSKGSVTRSTVGGLSFVELILAGGEKVCFGKGIINGDGSASVSLPTGYSLDRSIILAVPVNGVETGDNDAHGFRGYVDAAGVAHSDYQDGEGHIWHGNVEVFVFAWLNNMGTWGTVAGWQTCPVAGGKSLCVGGFSILDAGLRGTPEANFPTTSLETVTDGVLPLPAIAQASLQVFATPNGHQIVDHPTHGIRQCYVDGDLNSLASFEDGEGNIWYGSAGVFGLLYDELGVTPPPPPPPPPPPDPIGDGPSLSGEVTSDIPLAIDLTWGFSFPSGPGTFQLQRATAGPSDPEPGDGAFVDVYGGTGFSYHDTDLLTDTTYWYRIRAWWGGSMSNWSSQSITTPPE